MESDLDGILLFLDSEKAFDSVEYNVMFKTLEKLKFSDKEGVAQMRRVHLNREGHLNPRNA